MTRRAFAPEPDLLVPTPPAIPSLDRAREEIGACTRCDLFKFATQAVFGGGPEWAQMVLVGEQPGDSEDLAGKPFVGPAGRVLVEAMAAAGIDRDLTYVTNAVKHFKFEPRGKRRLHKKPNAGEVAACRFWLDAERTLLQPKVIVALGATALRGLLDKAVAVSSLRGRPVWLDGGGWLLATIHPSYLLRLRDPADQTRERSQFVADLRAAQALLPTAPS